MTNSQFPGKMHHFPKLFQKMHFEKFPVVAFLSCLLVTTGHIFPFCDGAVGDPQNTKDFPSINPGAVPKSSPEKPLIEQTSTIAAATATDVTSSQHQKVSKTEPFASQSEKPSDKKEEPQRKDSTSLSVSPGNENLPAKSSTSAEDDEHHFPTVAASEQHEFPEINPNEAESEFASNDKKASESISTSLLPSSLFSQTDINKPVSSMKPPLKPLSQSPLSMVPFPKPQVSSPMSSSPNSLLSALQGKPLASQFGQLSTPPKLIPVATLSPSSASAMGLTPMASIQPIQPSKQTVPLSVAQNSAKPQKPISIAASPAAPTKYLISVGGNHVPVKVISTGDKTEAAKSHQTHPQIQQVPTHMKTGNKPASPTRGVPPTLSCPALDKKIMNLVRSVDRKLRPRSSDNSPTAVNINAFIRNIYAIDEKANTWTVHFTFREMWNDPRLEYDIGPGCPNYNFLTLTSSEDIWTPGLYFPRGKTSIIHEVAQPNTLVRVSPNGDVILSNRYTSTMHCTGSGSVGGEHLCKFSVSSYAYTTDEIDLKWIKQKPIQIERSTPEFIDSKEYALERLSLGYTDDVTVLGKYRNAYAKFHFMRNQCGVR